MGDDTGRQGSCGVGHEPSVGGVAHGLYQGVTPEGVLPVGVGVVDHPPVAVGIVDERAVPFRPPRLRGAVGVHERIVGRVFPRTVHRT